MFYLLLTATLIFTIIYALNLYKRKIAKFQSLEKFPGPPIFEFLKILCGTSSINEKYRYIINLNAKYGPVVKIWLKPSEPLLQVTDVRFFEKILLSKKHLMKTDAYMLWAPYFNENALAITKDIELWKKSRKLLNPALSAKNVDNLFPVFAKYAEIFVEKMKSEVGKVIDIQPMVHLLTLDMIFESSTGYETNFLKNQNHSYLNARKQYSEILAEKLYSPLLQIDPLFRLTTYYNKMIESVSVLKPFTKNIVSERMKNISNVNILDTLLKSDQTIDLIRGNVDMTILAGHDTIAASISYTCFELSERPNVQSKILQEAEEMMEELNETTLTPTVINRMKFLDSVIKESLRYYSIVSFIERYVGEDFEVDGVNIPAGTRVMFNINKIHFSEEYYEDADVFDAERFLPENSHKIAQNAFVPFSIGPRDCIGKYYAYLAIKFIIAKVLTEFELLPVTPKHKMDVVNAFITTSTNGVPVIFKRRK